MQPINRTVIDILDSVGDIAVLSIIEDGVGHAYFGDEVDDIDPDVLESPVRSWFIVKKSYGFIVEVEV